MRERTRRHGTRYKTQTLLRERYGFRHVSYQRSSLNLRKRFDKHSKTGQVQGSPTLGQCSLSEEPTVVVDEMTLRGGVKRGVYWMDMVIHTTVVSHFPLQSLRN